MSHGMLYGERGGTRRVVCTIVGCCLLRCCLMLWAHSYFVHVNPNRTMANNRRMLKDIGNEVQRCKGVVFVGGDWSFVVGGNVCERLDHRGMHEDLAVRSAFDECVETVCELHQQEPTTRRLPAWHLQHDCSPMHQHACHGSCIACHTHMGERELFAPPGHNCAARVALLRSAVWAQ